jgi:Zn-dependent protease
MNWSFRLGRILGTEIRVHLTFLVLLVWYWIVSYQEGGLATASQETGFLLALFLCVLLHEFGHILMARRFGVRTPDVILLPIGGVARLERIPDEPKQELLIAIAGPLVTLAIAVTAYLLLRATGRVPTFTEEGLKDPSFLVRLMWTNWLLLFFNLIPAFPMDGGRVLRALLATRLGLLRATRIAAGIGQSLAVLFGIAGLFGNVILVLIAVFVFAGASQEAAAVETRLAGRGLRIDQMMVTRFEVIPVHARLRTAVDLLLAGDQREFPVVDNAGRVEGLLTRESLIKALTNLGPDATAGEAMVAPVTLLPVGLEFEKALASLRSSGLPALPVVAPDGRLVGLLSFDNITDLIRVRRAGGMAMPPQDSSNSSFSR